MNRKPRAFAIVNPAAGGGRGARLVRRIAEEFDRAGMIVEVVATPGPAEAARLAAGAVDDGHDTIIAVGGDGTANEVANGMIGSNAALALYPIGSGNDLARSLGYPRGRKRKHVARWLATEATRRPIDVGEANGRLFLNAAGVGIDGDVAERLARGGGGRSMLTYLGASIRSVATYRPRPMELRLDGETMVGRFLAVIASNGKYFGSGMRPAPRARMDDGVLDVTVAGDVSPLGALVALAKIYVGKHEDGTTIVTRNARELDIEFEHELAIEIDGEVARADRLKVRVRPQALQVLGAP